MRTVRSAEFRRCNCDETLSRVGTGRGCDRCHSVIPTKTTMTHIGTQRYYVAKLDQAVALQLGTFVLILSWRGKLTLKRYWAT